MVLAWQATSKDFVEQVRRRHRFLSEQIEEDRAALAAVIAQTSAGSDAAMGVRVRFGLLGAGPEGVGRDSAGRPPGCSGAGPQSRAPNGRQPPRPPPRPPLPP